MFDTITAISTGGMRNVPISIIRLSGSESFCIAKKIFSGLIGHHKTITYGFIKDGDLKIDEVLISWFKSPNTFTGEDVVEINAHGGVVNTNRILKLLLSNGARLAEKGEFSRRAFLNGKIDLIKAEAIHDLIFSKTNEQANLSVKKFDGETSELIKRLKKKILKVIATIETNIDYPKYDDVEDIISKKLLPKLLEVEQDLSKILESSKKSKYIFDGVSAVIVGRPNAGKSSLLNALLNEDKAIVTNSPGTTRDVVEGSIQIGQILFKFMDTAGVHKSNDSIEKLGIKKSIEKIDQADLVIHLVDVTQDENEDDHFIEKHAKSKTYLKVFNKVDIKSKKGLTISASKKQISNLTNKILDIYQEIDLDNKNIVNNTRQLSLIDSANHNVKEAISSLNNGFFPDTVIIDIQKAWENLSNVLGRADSADLLDEMFKNFCLGK